MTRILLIISFLAFIGCNKEEYKKHNNTLVGKWKRVEVFISPGDAGCWQPDKSETPITLEFAADGRLISNDQFYSTFTGYLVKGDNTIEFQPPLNGTTRAVYFAFNSSTQLTLTFACIEGCGERYVRY